MTKKFKILIAHPDAGEAAAIASHFESQLGASVSVTGEGHRALELLASSDFDVLVTAPTVGSMSAVELIKESRKAAPGLAILLTGEMMGERAVAEAVKAGAAEFVPCNKTGMKKIGQCVLKAMREAQRRVLLETEEEHTRELELMYKASFDKAPVPLAITDREGKVIAASERAREMISGGLANLGDVDVLSLFSGYDRQEFSESIEAGEFPVEFTANLVTHTGEEIPVSVTIESLEGAPGLMAIAIIDLSRPASYRRMWEYLMKDARDIIVLVDRHGLVLSVSQGALDMTGLDSSEMVGEMAGSIGHPANEKSARGFLKQLENKDYASLDNYEYRRRDGQLRYVSGSCYRLTGGNYLMIGKDVTEKRQQELDLEVFGQMAAHELRTPLTALSGYIDLMERAGGQSDESLDNLEKMRICASRLEAVAAALLDISKAGRSDAQLETLDSQEAAEEVIDTLSPVISETAGRVVITERLPEITYRKADFQVVLSNLVSNALQYGGGEEGPLVHISSKSYPGRTLYFVKDFGPGIADSIRDKILVPFFKTQESKGMGLGLALAKRIVEYHGGDLWFESWEGEGSTFYFSVPSR